MGVTITAEIYKDGELYGYRMIDNYDCRVRDISKEAVMQGMIERRLPVSNATVNKGRDSILLSYNHVETDFPKLLMDADGNMTEAPITIDGKEAYRYKAHEMQRYFVLTKYKIPNGTTIFKVCNPRGEVKLLSEEDRKKIFLRQLLIIVNKVKGATNVRWEGRVRGDCIACEEARKNWEYNKMLGITPMIYSDSFDYKGTVNLVECGESYHGNVAIPDWVSYIGEKAFKGNKGIDGIKLGAGVKGIGPRAFESLGDVRIELNKGLEYIREFAFSYSYMRELVIPSTVMTIANLAFNESYVDRVVISQGALHEAMQGMSWIRHSFKAGIAKELVMTEDVAAKILRFFGTHLSYIPYTTLTTSETLKEGLEKDYGYQLVCDIREVGENLDEIKAMGGNKDKLNIPFNGAEELIRLLIKHRTYDVGSVKILENV